MSRQYSTPIELRFSDFDVYGHVNSVTYFTFFETARVKLFKELFRELTEQGIFLVVARAECDYRLPILADDSIVVTLWIARLGSTSFDLEYSLHDGADRVFATAKTTLVCFDDVRKAPAPIPQRLKSMAQ